MSSTAKPRAIEAPPGPGARATLAVRDDTFAAKTTAAGVVSEDFGL